MDIILVLFENRIMPLTFNYSAVESDNKAPLAQPQESTEIQIKLAVPNS